MIATIPNPVRWILFLPLAIGAGFLVGGLIRLVLFVESGPLAYAATFLSGLAYVLVALHVAHAVAPAHKKLVVIVLGFLILGDMSVVHLLLQGELIPGFSVAQARQRGVGVILGALRVDDYGGLPNAGPVKVGGVLAGCFLAWRMYVRQRVVPS